jgi:thiol:disulfide interchange protein
MEQMIQVRALKSNCPSPIKQQAAQLKCFYLLPTPSSAGGLILNIMPCVLPVIALKILGFVSEAKSSPRRVRALGGIYAVGVLFSFLVLAAIVIGVKAAGHQAGWGMQFGSPVFIVCLTTLVTLVALNLFGVFEVTLGGSALDAAGNLASRHGASGAFFNGVLATTLATPCTAPFLAPALGFAFAQSAVNDHFNFSHRRPRPCVAVCFAELESGVAEIFAEARRVDGKIQNRDGLPDARDGRVAVQHRDGELRQKCFVARRFSRHRRVRRVDFRRVFPARTQTQRHAAAIVALILLGGGYVFALEKELDWRTAMPETDTTGSLKESADGIDWQRWSPEAVAQARAAGKPVLVDFTADWCLTCQVNKKTSIEIPSVRKN